MGIIVVERKFFGEIGSLDGGMKIYGGENVELGIRVRSDSFEQLDYIAICSCDVVRLIFFAGLVLRREHRSHTLFQNRPHRTSHEALSSRLEGNDEEERPEGGGGVDG